MDRNTRINDMKGWKRKNMGRNDERNPKLT